MARESWHQWKRLLPDPLRSVFIQILKCNPATVRHPSATPSCGQILWRLVYRTRTFNGRITLSDSRTTRMVAYGSILASGNSEIMKGLRTTIMITITIHDY
ncbi:hypothetical protein L0156_24570 [bacterium]|nr:hypothetical protein [bacterium]